MRNRPYELWLIWQNVETRQRYHVGNLIYDNGTYKFYYEKKGNRRKLSEALHNGYKPHLAFPDVDKVYTSDKLFGPFERRLPDKRRPDFKELLAELGLPYDYTEMDLLRATGGRLATDSYEFVAPIFIEGNHFDFDFYVAGWRYYEGNRVINHLKQNDHVRFHLHFDNPEDDKAVLVLSVNGHRLGYVPAFYSGFMFEVIQKNCKYTAKIECINPNGISQRKVNISVVGQINKTINMESVFNSNDTLQLIKQ